ncbi:MAG: PEP-CTERM sorting domain-containing protein [Planctomycetes bacterium]|nr:PEP-CTERM sorting domain-containing protein [Planctomycetota bacterium]
MLTNRTLLLTIGLCIAALTASAMADGPTLNYMVKINDQDVASVSPGTAGVAVGTPFEVSIWVNVPDVDFGGGYYGGCLQYSCSLTDSDGKLSPDESVGGPPTFPPLGTWNSASTPPMSNYKGDIDVTVESVLYDVFGQAGAVTPGDFATYYNEFGAGPGVWSKVGWGDFTWNGEETTLTLIPGALEGMLVYGMSGGGEFPVSSTGDAVEFLPEPATMTLLALGGLALIRRRRA